jgi:hypothetical protein
MFSRIAGPEKLKFTGKLFDVVKKRKFVKIMGMGWGHNRGKLLLHVFI